MTDSAAAAVAAAYAEMMVQGLCAGSSGNVSVRDGAGMLITCSGADRNVAAEHIVAVDLDGGWSGPLKPSSEWEMHAAIYRAKPEAAAVVHTHSDYCTALSALGEAMPPFHYMVLGFGGSDVPCAPYHTFGSPELAVAAVAALDGRTACLLSNHGMICHGTSLRAAVDAAIRLEVLARQYLIAASVRPPRLLTEGELAQARERYKTYGNKAASRDALAPAGTGTKGI